MTPKTLTQGEIDALLSLTGDETTSPGGEMLITSDRAVKPYDFRRPDKFSRDHLRAIQNIHVAFARSTAAVLTSYLGTPTNILLSAVEQVVYDDYIQQVVNPTVVALVELPPLSGRVVVEMNLNVVLAMLNRMMGGNGHVGPRRGEPTDIELALVQRLCRKIVATLRPAWASVAEVEPTLVETVMSAELVQAALPGDMAALSIFEVQVLGVGGGMTICVPHPVVEPLMPRLNTQAWIASARKSPAEDARSQLAAQLNDATLRVAVELGTARVRVSDLLSLQPDDIIRLDRSVQSDLLMYVGARPRFQARAGTVAGNRGVQITAILSDGAPGPTPAHS